MTKVIKRNGTQVEFNKEKIEKAILKAMKSSGNVRPLIAKNIADEIESENVDKDIIYIHDIEEAVFNKLISKKQKLTARSYEGYRSIREYQREVNTIDESVLGLFNGSNIDALTENSNKNEQLVSTGRDLVAEEVSKDIALRKMLPTHIAQAHKDGIIHLHDLGHYMNKSINCALVNLKDMLDNGTCINEKLIESPHKFSTACNIATQIIAQVASGQFGGQTITLSHLAPYLRKSKVRIENTLREDLDGLIPEEKIQKLIHDRLQEELTAGVQTFNYQVNTLMTANGFFR